MKVYNKLVRDKIPQIIESNGKQCSVRVLDDAKNDAALKIKMQEELNEFLEATEPGQQMEELADLLEVVYAFVQNKGVGLEELERIRQEKYVERGGFQQRIFLQGVEG
ncbi:phosphoribosyl-ATP pyrophosphohydrolase [Brevibacillus sp. 179-C9.3 HS]|uniref:phosphoribosyl-ATP pyrophosphohydrolase n=1 Tax=unclassified Brevibacillus TaxID=2684853 RepID=UPI0039A350B6